MLSLQKFNFIKQKLHIGKILQEAVEKTGLKKDIITHKAGYKRSSYYLHIKQPDLKLDILKKYAKAISHDFSDVIPELTEFTVSEEDEKYAKPPINLQEAIKQIEEWKEKYLTLLEKHLKLIEGQKS